MQNTKFKSLVEIFFEDAAQNPQEPLIYYFDTKLTKGEITKYSNSFAYFLKENGAEKGDRIAIYTQNIPQFIIAELAAWKLGAIIVPLNIMFKQKELEYHLNDSGSRFFVTQEVEYETYAKSIIPKTNIKLTVTTSGLDFLDSSKIPDVLKRETKTNPLGKNYDFLEIISKYEGKNVEMASIKPSDIALISYTSGTTGPPKGAMNTHYNCFYNAKAYKEVCHLTKQDVNVGLAPLFHITGAIAGIAVSLYVGFPIILFYRYDAGEVLRLIEKWRGTFSVAATTAYIGLMDHPDIKKRDISSFKKSWSGGAPVPPAIVERWEDLTGGYIYNVWGMTETTSPGTITPINERAPVDPVTKALSIGKAVPGAEVKIVDEETGERELAFGEVGELIEKGPFIVPGYWQKPEETAHAIRNGWLYTGDLAKIDEEGWVYYIDRKKDLINVSGFKVWPREVEEVLYKHPAVKEVTVVGVPEPSYRGEVPKAFIVLKEEFKGKIDAEDLISFAKDMLANYKYPREVEFLDELPKTPTGKVLRKELREREKEKREQIQK